MDNLTHSLAGSALAAAGLRRATPLATATLVVAANAPDLDAFVYAFEDPYFALAFRRGWTHGPLALVLLPFLVAGGVLAYDRLVRLRRDPSAAPARGRPLLLLAFLGVLTHPALDWMNTYGIRLLMPFTGRWFYGDALFIVDPWLWLALGTATLAAFRPHGRAWVGWGALAALATALILGVGMVPPAAKAAWLLALAGIALLLLWLGRARPRERLGTRAARWALGLGVAYILAMTGSDLAAARRVREAAAEYGIGPVEAVMVAPLPARPFEADVVVRTPTAYHRGSFHWLASPRVRIGRDSLPIPPSDAVIEAAARIDDVRDYLVWSRFPTFIVDTLPDGYRVRVGDARYAGEERAGSLAGLTVLLDRKLEPVEP